MPGNEIGDRVHNFFGQETLSHSTHQLQPADGSWPVLTDNTWVGSQNQFANSEGVGHGNLLPSMSDSFSHTKSNLRPEFGSIQASNQQKTLNGFVQGHHMLQTRQNEANFLGGIVVSDRKYAARDLTLQEAQRLDCTELKNKKLMGLETTDANVSFDLFGGQQQTNGGHLNMMQSKRRQHSGIPDSQLRQQQAIISQREGLQRHQQPQFEARHHGSVIMIQDTGNHSSGLSGSVPVNDNPNYSWQHEHIAGNVNWPQYDTSPVMHGSSSGLMLASEQNHALQMMGLIHQKNDLSSYSVHSPTRRSISGPTSLTPMDKTSIQHLSGTSNSFPLNQYTAFPDQSDMPYEASIMRHNFQGKSLFEHNAGHSLNRLNSENLHLINPQQGNVSMQENQGKRLFARQSETLNEKTEMQVISSQYVATLDPTEEKILYGSDDSLCDAFGGTTTLCSGVSNMLDGVVFDSGFSSLQSGTWSALMQSAVAETLTGTGRVQEEWSGLSSQNAGSPNENQHHVSVSDSGKLLPVWVGSNMQTASILKSESRSPSVDANRHLTSINYCDASGFRQELPKSSYQHGESLQTYTAQMPYFSEEESRCLDPGLLQKPLAEGLQISKNVNNSSGFEIKTNNLVGSWTSQQSILLRKNVNQHEKQNGWNFIGSMYPGRDVSLKYHENQHMQLNPQGGNHRRAICEEMSHSTTMFKNNPVSNSRDEMLHPEPVIELSQLPKFYGESERVNGDAADPQSSTFSTNRENRQQYSHTGPHNSGKNVDSLVKKGHSFLDKYRHHLDNSSQSLESFQNNGLNTGESEILGMEEAYRKANIIDSFNSSISNHTSTGGLGEHLWSDVSEGRRLPVSKQKSTSNVARKPSMTRKFQYHPIGDLEVDVEPFNVTKGEHSQATTQEQNLWKQKP